MRATVGRGEYGPGDPDALVARRMALVCECRPHCFEYARHDGIEIEVRGVPLADGDMVTTYTLVACEFAAVAELVQGDAELVRELLDDFRQANASDLEAVARALRDESIDAVHRAAHRIKGAARTVGAAALAQAAAALEQAAAAGDWQRVRSAWPAVQLQGERVDARIEAHGRHARESP